MTSHLGMAVFPSAAAFPISSTTYWSLISSSRKINFPFYLGSRLDHGILIVAHLASTFAAEDVSRLSVNSPWVGNGQTDPAVQVIVTLKRLRFFLSKSTRLSPRATSESRSPPLPSRVSAPERQNSFGLFAVPILACSPASRICWWLRDDDQVQQIWLELHFLFDLHSDGHWGKA